MALWWAQALQHLRNHLKDRHLGGLEDLPTEDLHSAKSTKEFNVNDRAIIMFWITMTTDFREYS